MSDNILEIRMQCDGVECSLCGAETPFEYGVPTVNGDVVSNDFPEALAERLGCGSIPVCRRCFERHAVGQVPTFDRYYVRPGLMGVCLVDGAGI